MRSFLQGCHTKLDRKRDPSLEHYPSNIGPGIITNTIPGRTRPSGPLKPNQKKNTIARIPHCSCSITYPKTLFCHHKPKTPKPSSNSNPPSLGPVLAILPQAPCAHYSRYLGLQVPNIVTSLRPKNLLFRYMAPLGLIPRVPY